MQHEHYMKRVPQAEREAWAPLLGRIVIAFGNIEHAAVSLIAAATSQTFGGRASKLPLQPRLQVLDGLLRPPSLDAPLVEHWSVALSRVEDLRRNYRNAIAHGAPVVDIYEDRSGNVTFRLSHVSARLPVKSMTFAEIAKAASACEQAHMDLAKAGMALVDDLLRRHLLPLSEPTLPRQRRACQNPAE